jgi:heat shock protein HtpX
VLPVFGLYTHIQANRRRSIALLASLFALAYILAFAVVLLIRVSTSELPAIDSSVLEPVLRAGLLDMI